MSVYEMILLTETKKPAKIQPAKHHSLSVLCLCLMFGLVLFGNHSTALAGTNEVESKTGVIDQSKAPPGYGFSNGSLIIAPIPFSNPTIGSGLALGAGYLFKTDEFSSPSLIGIGAMRSDNGSEAYGLSLGLSLDSNRWKLSSFIGEADLNYDLFTSVGELPIRQQGTIARFGLLYGVTPQLSFGGSVKYLNSKIGLRNTGGVPIPPPFDLALDIEVFTLGFITDWDRRDDTIYPTSGSNLHFEANNGIARFAGSQNYQKFILLYDVFRSIGASSVFAGRIASCAASRNTPFFEQCSLGGTDSFRGFSATEFLDRGLASLQIEYRHRLSQRIGITVFGGIGGVGSSFGQLFDNGAQSAFGVGGRYRVSKKFPVDFSVDYTINDQDTGLLYIYVGQRY
jgi:hypothetical protein